jgi:hypothetical protein
MRGMFMKLKKQVVALLFAVLSLSLTQVVFAESTDSLCSFILEGKTYTLPFDLTVLEEDGWSFSYPDPDYELGGMTATTLSLTKEIQGTSAYLSIEAFNGSGDNKKIKDCQVCSVTVSKKNTNDYNYSFSLLNGIKPGDDIETVMAAMGEPDNISEMDDLVIATYGDRKNGGCITFDCYDDNDRNVIVVEHYKKIETQTSETVPDYLKEYEAPNSIGTDLSEAEFSLDDVLYKLPCPVSVFEENGWSLTENDSVMAHRFFITELEKDGVTLRVNLQNFADYQTTAENCAVTSITAHYYPEKDKNVNMELSKGISFDSTKEDIEASGLFEKNVGDDSIGYEYTDVDSNVYYLVTYKTEEKMIPYMTIQKVKWNDMVR